jgi:hypothetical protein
MVVATHLPPKLEENTTLEIKSYSRAILDLFILGLILVNVYPRASGVVAILNVKV